MRFNLNTIFYVQYRSEEISPHVGFLAKYKEGHILGLPEEIKVRN